MKPQTKPNDVASKLRAAKALIADEAHWCQGTYAVAQDGAVCDSTADIAYGRCVWGAIQAVHAGRKATEYLYSASVAFGSDPSIVNDETDHATVMRMFDRAIELAEAQSRAGVA